MRPAVAAIFPKFSETYEGNVPWPYADCEGKITVGIGCLCDTPAEFHALSWRDGDGELADEALVQHSYEEVRAAAVYMPGSVASRYEAVTTIRLNPGNIVDLCLGRARFADDFLAQRLLGYSTAPANAQLGVLSMAYAVGSAGVVREFPKFCEAFSRGDWATCALECHMDDRKNAGLRPRNRANRTLFAACCDPIDPDQIVGWPLPKSFPVGAP